MKCDTLTNVLCLTFSPIFFGILGVEGKNKIKQPNIIFILADDLGCTDLAFTGSDFHETPHLDRLAAEGMVFTQAYAACPVSSPTRAALMTGKYPARIRLTDYIPGNRAYGPHKDQQLAALPFNLHLNPTETTIAEVFQQNGYTTFIAGKWHLSEEEKYYPEQNGFSINKGANKTGHPAGGYFSPYKNPQLSDGPKGEYLADRLTDELIHFMRIQNNEPFFAYLSFYNVHLPLQAKADKVEKYVRKLATMDSVSVFFTKHGKTYHKEVQDRAVYAGMIESLDENIGRLLAALKERDLDKQTIIIFTSDNGGMATANQANLIPTSNRPYRAGKGHLYEGGIKVPSIIRWNGHIPVGRSSFPITTTDYYPTLLDLCGIPLLFEQHQDGVSLKPILYGVHQTRKAIYWHYPHYSGGLGGTPSAAIRMGNYKLIEFFEDDRIELYDVVNDVAEHNNLVSAVPLLATSMRKQLHKWYKVVDAQMPIQNPHYLKSSKSSK